MRVRPFPLGHLDRGCRESEDCPSGVLKPVGGYGEHLFPAVIGSKASAHQAVEHRHALRQDAAGHGFLGRRVREGVHLHEPPTQESLGRHSVQDTCGRIDAHNPEFAVEDVQADG